jgi:restriction system protein
MSRLGITLRVIKCCLDNFGRTKTVARITRWLNDRFKMARRAEDRVKWKLRLMLNPIAYRSQHNVLLRKVDGGTTEIDHVVISRYGIFVIETKHWNDCWIVGDEKRLKWSVYYKGGNRKSRQNPLRQNRGHIRALADVLDLSPEVFHNIVWLSGNAELKYGEIAGVLQSGLVKYIKSVRVPVFTKQEMIWITEGIRAASIGHIPGAYREHRQDCEQRKLAGRSERISAEL